MDNFKEIFEKYRPEIFSFILKIVNYREDLAEELTQETFYQLFISFHRFKGNCILKTWICKIAKNTCYKYFSKNPIHISIDTEKYKEHQKSTYSIEKYVENKELSLLLFNSINKLKKKYRDVIIYRVYFELPYSQISKLLNITENTAKVIYFRGKEILKKQWGNIYE